MEEPSKHYAPLPQDIDLEEYGSTPLEGYMKSGRFAKHFCCCFSTTKTIAWSLFVVFVFVNAFLTANHTFQDDQFALRDERDIAGLIYQVQNLQNNQKTIIEALLIIASSPEKQQAVQDIIQARALRVNCQRDPNDPMCAEREPTSNV